MGEAVDSNDEFGDEFNSIKQLPDSEIGKDSMLKRLKRAQNDNAGLSQHRPKRSKKVIVSSTNRSASESSNRTTHRSGASKKFKKIKGIQLINSTMSTTAQDDVSSTDDEGPYAPQKVTSSHNPGPTRDINGGYLSTELEIHKRIHADRKLVSSEVHSSGVDSNALPILDEDLQIAKGNTSGNNELGFPDSNTDKSIQKAHVTTDDRSVQEIMGKFDECQVSSGDVRRVRDQIMHQLSGGFANFGHSKQLKEKFNELYMLFEHTVNDKEGHSALLIGPRSTGKTTIINKALEELESKYSGQFLTIRLNATIHSDDGIALREIARQLDEEVKRINAFQVELEYQLDNTNFEQRSINDTFANILLSLDNNMHSEQDEASTTISIIFVIEEFEKFTNNNKQTLLYNLFDLSQSSSTAVCVLGVSTKVTTRELLERRVRSRFSQRIITTSKSSSLEEFWTDAKLGLLFDESLFNSLDNAEYGKLWNSYFEFLFNECAQVTNFRKLVFQNYYTVKNIKDFYNSCMFAVSQIHSSAPFPSDMVFSKYLNSQLSNCVQGIVRSLSTSELLLTIAAARWVEKYELQAINFNLAYAEYKSMMKNYNLNTTSGSTGLDSKMISNFRINHKLFSSKILRTCWESLYKLGLLLDSGGITTNNEGHIITNANLNKNLIIEENKMVQLDITLDEISTFMDDHNAFKRLTKL